jgi:NADPH:quinone reductase-like Zn-dependent oxidoreductase
MMTTMLITGGSSGVGAATANLFAERGFNDKSKSTPYGRGHRLTGYAC